MFRMANLNFMEKAEKLICQYSGCVGFSIRSLDGKEKYEYQQDHLFSSASVVKIFVLGCFLKMVEEGKRSLNAMLSLKEQDKVDGSGILLDMSEGMMLCTKDVAMLMIILSDNTATNMLIDYVGGVERVTEHLKTVGIVCSRVNRKISDNPESVAQSNFGDASPEELMIYLYKMEKGQILSPKGKTIFFDMLSRQHYKNLFTRYMPITDYYDTYEPDQVKVFNKTGFMDGIRTDAGKLEMGSGKTYIYSVMTNQCADITYSPDREADLFPALLGKIFYECVSE